MKYVPSRTDQHRSALFLSPRVLQGIMQAIADHNLADNLFSRLLREAKRDLERPLKGNEIDKRDSASLSRDYSVWYAELQEAHRESRVISRLSICHAISGEPDLASDCKKHMKSAAVHTTGWDNPMQDLIIAVLARSLCIARDILYDTEALGNRSEPDSVLPLVETRLLEMGDWLEYYLTKGGLGLRRNHDVIVACTLGLIALALRAGEITEGWAHLAIDRLDELLYTSPRYLGEDGDWYESSLRYQFYILQWFPLFADACRNVGLRDYYAIPKTERLFRALSHFITPDGHNLGFNDTSHDEVIMLGLWPLLKGATEYQDETLFCNLRRIITSLPETPLIAAESMLALGNGSIPAESHVEADTVVHFRRTGTVVARSDWSESASLFALECGPYVSHSHLSRGTFEYYCAGQPVILDAGCGHYVDRLLWIAPEMHNIVVVNGGYKPRYPHPLYRDEAWDFAPDFHGRIMDVRQNRQLTFIQADYAAFARVPMAARNTWFVSPGYLLIEDHIRAKPGRSAEYSAYFHAYGTIRRETEDRHAVIVTPKGMRVHLEVLEPSQCNLTIGQHPLATESMASVKSGGECHVPPRDMSVLEYLRIQVQGDEAWFLVAIVPQGSQDGAADVELHKLDKVGDSHILQIRPSEDVTDVWLFQQVEGLAEYDDLLQTDGRVAFVRLVAEQPVSWFLLEGKLLAYRRVPLIDSPVSTTFLRR